ncbi:MAG: diguanylate cyclase [Myxococcota bacterium]
MNDRPRTGRGKRTTGVPKKVVPAAQDNLQTSSKRPARKVGEAGDPHEKGAPIARRRASSAVAPALPPLPEPATDRITLRPDLSSPPPLIESEAPTNRPGRRRSLPPHAEPGWRRSSPPSEAEPNWRRSSAPSAPATEEPAWRRSTPPPPLTSSAPGADNSGFDQPSMPPRSADRFGSHLPDADEAVRAALSSTVNTDSGIEAAELLLPMEPLDSSEITSAHAIGAVVAGDGSTPAVALGETLQLVHYARRGDTLLITGITPHGRRLTFEQREDRQGWYVVAAGRRRRPTDRELGLVVATITQEMEAALAPEPSEVRSAYRLAGASDQPGMPVGGLEAYRDLLLDECAAYIAGIIERLKVVAIEYQAFKRFANRHGHRVGAAFVQALGERLANLFAEESGVHVFHKTGKSFRLIIVNRSSEEIDELIARITSDETREWLVRRVWGDDQRTHPDEVHFHIGVARASRLDRDSEYSDLAQRLSDDAYRASKLGQLLGHTSIALAKSDYRTTVHHWTVDSENELQELSTSMDDGPAEVMAEMSDYLHELVPADLEGMAVAGDLEALIHRAIARAGFWQGTTAMRIAGERLLRRIFDPDYQPDPSENDFVAGFDLGDEFYGISIEEDCFYFARGDVNHAGATRVRAGLAAVQQAVGWERSDGRGIVGHFVAAMADRGGTPLVERIRRAAQVSYEENAADEGLQVNDAVDIADFLFTPTGELAEVQHVEEGAPLVLAVPGIKPKDVRVIERRSGFTLRLLIEGQEHPAVFADSMSGLQVKLRIRDTVASAAICVLRIPVRELHTLLAEIREENLASDDRELDVLGFLRHISDILLEDHVKAPAKVEMALGTGYDARRFVRVFRMEDVREGYPGLFYEAVHMDLLGEQPPTELDRQLLELVGHTMLSSARPELPAPK